MKFVDEGYIIRCRRHGENSLILTVLCKENGKVCGYVRSGLSKKNLVVFQLGNKVRIDAWSRVDDNMLSLKIELITPDAVNFLNDVNKLRVLSCFCALCDRCLPELQPLDRFYWFAESFVNLIGEDNWIGHYCFFEFYLLDFLGIGLDLSKCSVTGKVENLAFVSPKTGRAVCQEVGRPYQDRLFLFPHFIVAQDYSPKPSEMAELLKMTEFFLNKNFFAIHNLKFPECRVNLAEIIEKS